MQDNKNTSGTTPDKFVFPFNDSSSVTNDTPKDKSNDGWKSVNFVVDKISLLGKYLSVIMAVIITLVCSVLLFNGMMMIYYNFKYSKKVEGVVTKDTEYKASESRLRPSYYQTEVKYTVDGSIYSGILYSSSSSGRKEILSHTGDKIVIYYEPKNPKHISNGNYFSVGGSLMLILFCITFISLAWFWVYVTKKNKIASTLSGVRAIKSVI